MHDAHLLTLSFVFWIIQADSLLHCFGVGTEGRVASKRKQDSVAVLHCQCLPGKVPLNHGGLCRLQGNRMSQTVLSMHHVALSWQYSYPVLYLKCKDEIRCHTKMCN